MTRASIRPEMLRWACERADRELSDLAVRYPGLIAWERGENRSPLEASLDASRLVLLLPDAEHWTYA